MKFTKSVWSYSVLLTVTFLLGIMSAFAASGGNGGGGGGGGGGGTTTGTNPLPQTAPAPDILMRDSFGQGPELLRPAGGKGALKSTATGGTSFNGFWLEYPGNKNNRWVTADSGDTWRFCGTAQNQYELFSPLQFIYGYEYNTILCTLLNAPVTSATRPTALINLPAQTTPYEIEFDGIYHRLPGAYFAVGLTNSALTANNLTTNGLVLVTKPNPADNLFTMIYELRYGGMNGQILISGETEETEFFNQMKLRYYPATRSISASFKGMELGTFPVNMAPPRYAAIEGIGYADNFVMRSIQ